MINKVKSIEELYEEVKDFDLVITNDAPLNTALNKTINKAMLGSFALTSRLIGSKYCDYLFEEKKLDHPELVLKIQKEFKLNLKEALYYVKNIMFIWQNIGNLEETKKYLSNKEKDIVKVLEKLPTYQLSMQNMDLSFLEKKNIAVIGEELFNELDKRVLSLSYTKISPFTNNEHKLDTIYLFNSQKDIVDRVISMINKDNQNSIAIVLNIESDYLPLIKARLINNGIELNEKLFLFQEFKIREYLSIIETFYSMYNVYTKELIPIGNIFNIDIDSIQENSLFLELIKIDKNAKQLFNILQNLKNKTFGELVLELENYDLKLALEFKEILFKLELYNVKINKKKFLELKYFIENFEKEIETNKRGVLLIDAKNSTFINREIIFYLGMDYSWTKTIDDAKYIDKKKELDRNIQKFEILIQQGKERFFFIPKYTNGIETIPPFYFNFLYKTNVEKYSLEIFDIKELENNFENNKFENVPDSKRAELKIKNTISNSGLNNFSLCPKKYAYSSLVSGLNKEIFLRGNLVHAFAQFYVNNQEFVKNKDINEFVDIIMNNLKLMSNPFENSVLKTKIKFACIAIIEFIDKLKIDENLNFESFKEISSKNKENIFAIHYNKSLNKSNAELEFKDEDLKLNGVIDLAVNKELIIDYKTSKTRKKVIEITRNANLKNISSKCDFQALVYLSIFRKINPNKRIQFWYNFPMCDIYEKIIGKKLEDNSIKVHYIPSSFLDYISSKDFYIYFKETAPKYAENILNLIEDFSYFKDKLISEELLEETDELLEILFDDFKQYLIGLGLKDNKANNDNAFKVLKNIFAFRIGLQYRQKEVFFFKEDLDKFQKYVDLSIDKINRYMESSFPYQPIDGDNTCNECDFKKICLRRYEE